MDLNFVQKSRRVYAHIVSFQAALFQLYMIVINACTVEKKYNKKLMELLSIYPLDLTN